MKRQQKDRRKIGLAVMLSIAIAAPSFAQTGPNFIHGSWVNVRASPDAGARVTDHLVTNTAVQVQGRPLGWCQISYGVDNKKTGFVACNLLGEKALTLAQAAQEPGRAFWIAPSPNRLAAYGQSLQPPASLRLDVLKQKLKAGDTVQYPAVPEFEAAKKLMKAGVMLDPANEIQRGNAVDMNVELRGLTVRPAAIRPSLFRSQESVALISEADADGLAAVAGTKLSLQPTGLPTAWYTRHNGPEIEGVSGFWDVGIAVLDFTPSMVIYSVAANGLVGASALSKHPFDVGGEGHYCGAQYQGRSLPMGEYLLGLVSDGFESRLVPGYAALKDSSEVLASFVVPQKFTRKSVKIKTQSQEAPRLKDYEETIKFQPDWAQLKPKLTLREIDLDGDGVADLMQLERPVAYGQVSTQFITHRSWYVNIKGQWFKAGDWEDEDCT